MVVTFSHGGYVKSQPLADYRAQRRGGRGKMATTMKEDDFIERLFVAHSHDHLLCFSNRGRLYWLKVYEVPAGSRSARGHLVDRSEEHTSELQSPFLISYDVFCLKKKIGKFALDLGVRPRYLYKCRKKLEIG